MHAANILVDLIMAKPAQPLLVPFFIMLLMALLVSIIAIITTSAFTVAIVVKALSLA